ncbi:MAG TPA: helix-turn-helix domain-containing protein [Abditibacterium sp.]
MTRPQTPHFRVAQLFCDRFQQGPSYSSWRPTGSEDWLLIHTDAGCGQFRTRVGTLLAREGQVVLFAPGELQDYGTSPTEDSWELMWVHFQPRPHWSAWLKWPHHENGLKHLALAGNENHEPFRAALERMWHLSRRNLPGALDLASNALEEALLWADVAVSHTHEAVADERVRQAADFLRAHLKEPFLLEKLAARCGLSVSRLSHLFKEQLGISPQQFLERHRVQHASHLLELTQMSIAEIAREVGYNDPFYFSNRFRRHIGQSPLHFRQQRAR